MKSQERLKAQLQIAYRTGDQASVKRLLALLTPDE